MRRGDLFGFMGHLAEIGGGIFYFLARFFEPHGADTARVAGVYGTRFLAMAGLLNFLCVLDAWGNRARGKKLKSLWGNLRFSSGHGFNRAVTDAKSTRL